MNERTEGEWQDWYRLTPHERWRESMKLWEFYLAMGGSLDPEYDPQSPFNNDYYPNGPPADEPMIIYSDQIDTPIRRDCENGNYDPLDASTDLFRPPELSTLVGCLHCGEEYDSYKIEWRIETVANGKPHGFWCCPIRGCDGKGFGFDILPVDPDYRDANGELMWCSDDDGEEDAELPDDDEEPGDSPAGDEELPW